MLKKDKLTCAHCGAVLDLRVKYDGCDWDSVNGDGSGFGWEIVLLCEECGRSYPIGRIKNERDFCENIEKYRPYGAAIRPEEESGNA